MINAMQTPPKCYGDETHYSVCATAPASDCSFMLGCKVSVLHAAQKFKKPPCFGDRGTLLSLDLCNAAACSWTEQCMEDVRNNFMEALDKVKKTARDVVITSIWDTEDTEAVTISWDEDDVPTIKISEKIKPIPDPENKMNNAHPPLHPSCYGNVTHYSDCAMSRVSNCPFIEDCRVQVAQNTYKAPDARQVGGTHYKDMPVQPWELMETILTPEEFIGFLKGTLIKYAMRAGKKPGSDDASKYEHCKAKLDEVLSKTCYHF